MGMEQRNEVEPATPTHGNVELGCALVFTAFYWPFMSCAMAIFNLILGVPKEPFDWTLGFVPAMLIMSSSLQSVANSLSPDERNNWRTVTHKSLRILPFLLIMIIINTLADLFLQYGWSTANRYAFILFGSFAVGAVCAACTYLFWRLLMHPILNPRQPSLTK
jgi:hypothetical protein